MWEFDAFRFFKGQFEIRRINNYALALDIKEKFQEFKLFHCFIRL